MYLTNQANGLSVLRFDGSTDRILSAGVNTANVATIFVVVRFGGLVNNNDGLIQAGPSGTGFSSTTTDKAIGMWINTTTGAIWGRGVQSNNTIRDISQTTALSTGQFYIITQQYDGANIIQYVNGVQAGSNTYNGTLKSWTDFGIGRQASESLNGDLAEIIVHAASLNTAQRIITENYLAAKYDITLGANDLYNQDNASSGNYDHEVAGIGRMSASDLHNDARGSGMVRILNPSGLGNLEFMIWGHDGLAAVANEKTDVPPGIDARLNRVWRVSEVNTSGNGINVGAVSFRWDLSGLGAVTASHLVLLIDSDNDGVFSDETPVTGAASLGSGIYEFTGVTGISNNRRFTLGTTNAIVTALPLTLLDFSGKRLTDNRVILRWQTANEKNTAFFMIERSTNGLDWKNIGKVNAMGGSTPEHEYEFTDNLVCSSELYYRLRISDHDGSEEVSRIIFVNLLVKPDDISVFPNPAGDVLHIRGAGPWNQMGVYNNLGCDMTGSVRIRNGTNGNTSILLPELPVGVYVLRIDSNAVRFIKSGK